MLALIHNKSEEVIFKLMELGGRELIMKMDSNGKNILHFACINKNISLDAISKFIQIGGRELVMMTDKHQKTALRLCM